MVSVIERFDPGCAGGFCVRDDLHVGEYDGADLQSRGSFYRFLNTWMHHHRFLLCVDGFVYWVVVGPL